MLEQRQVEEEEAGRAVMNRLEKQREEREVERGAMIRLNTPTLK